MLEKLKSSLLAIIAVVAIVFAIQNNRLRKEQEAIRVDLASCQTSQHDLQARSGQLITELSNLRASYDSMQAEYEQLKAKRGGAKRSARR